MPDVHSILSASAGSRWGICPASLADKSSDGGSSRAAAEGTMAHGISEDILRGRAGYPAAGTKMTVDGHDFTVTEEILRDIHAYVSWAQGLPWAGPYNVESRVHYNLALRVPHAYAFGTSDLWGFTHEPQVGTVLNVIDLKFGRNPVNPVENSQGTLYGAGVVQQLYQAGVVLPSLMPARITIMQPRLSYKPFSWDTTVGHLLQRAQELAPAAQAGLRYHFGQSTADDHVSFPEVPGGHCHYCPRKGKCGAFQDTLKRAASTTAPVQWDEVAWRMRGAIKDYMEKLEAFGLAQAQSGNPMPGTKLVAGRRGNPTLLVPPETIRERARALGAEAEVVAVKEVWSTPAAIRDTFKRLGVPEAEIVKLVASPEGKPTLTDESDPRKSIVQAAGDVFKNFTVAAPGAPVL